MAETYSYDPSSSQALVALSFRDIPSEAQLHETQRFSSILPSPNTQDASLPHEQWQPILHSSNQVVLYNPRSHALSIASASASGALTTGVVIARRLRREQSDVHTSAITDACPYCKQSLPAGFRFPVGNSGVGISSPDALQDEDQELDGRWELFDTSDDDEAQDIETLISDPAYHSRASDYFRLLAIVNQTSSAASGSRRPSLSPARHDEENWRGRSRSRTVTPERSENTSTRGAFPAEKMAEGYFKTFFQEEYRLGMGANGSVFLCQHVLDGNALGHFAVKKIAVGESHLYLLKILREVRLLERLHHPNIITYHHAWLESSQFSSFGPKIPTLHVLMQWAEGGSLDDFIDARLGRKPAHIHMHPLTPSYSTSLQFTPNELPPDNDAHAPSGQEDPHSRSARIRAFRAFQRAPPEEKERIRREMESTFSDGSRLPGAPGPDGGKEEWTAVHLLSALEVKSLFQDVVEGLAFLHDRSILHLDLKPGNVLLTWDEGKLIPRAMLSDFGTSRDMVNSTRVQRSGNTGTLEYAAPESLPSPHTGKLLQIDSKADMWSLGMILHKLLFFKLPYRYAATGDANGEPISRNEEGEKMQRLEKEVLEYPGFKSTAVMVAGFETRRLPRAFLVLLENLLNKTPAGRPSCERVSSAIRDGKLDPLEDSPTQSLPLARWPDSPVAAGLSGESFTENVAVESGKSNPLALPSPTEVLGPEEGSWRSCISWRTWMRLAIGILFASKESQMHHRKRRKRRVVESMLGRWFVGNAMGMRILRSGLLILKVLTIPRACSDPLTRPRPMVAALLLVLAAVDTVIDYGDERVDPHVKKRQEKGEIGRRGNKRLMLLRTRGFWITMGLALFHVCVVEFSSAQAKIGGVGRRMGTICCIPLNEHSVGL